MPADLKALLLSLTILVSTYATFLCGTPPNPTPYNSKHRDSISRAITPRALFIRRFINGTLGIYHASLCLTGLSSPPKLLCPRPLNLDSDLFSWTPYSTSLITILLLGCYIRLSAFAALGASFTFRLDAPKKLVTSGLYSYVQHPSYTGRILITLANWALIQSPHGPIGCMLPSWVVDARWFWRVFTCWLLLAGIRLTRKRVRDEEMMMKDTFGEEWEAWHVKTKRFVPGLY